MSAKLLYSPWPIDAVAATSAATGYPASNITLPSCGRPWRSTSTAAQNLDIDLGTTRTAPVICLQGVNAATITLSYGAAAYTTTNAGTQTLAKDRHGRRKHSLALAGSVRFIRCVFGGSAPDDAAAYYEVGAAYAFGSTLTLPQNPLLGSEANPSLPQNLIQLPNGNEFVVERGVARQRMGLRFRGLRTDDLDELARRARAGVCWLDLDVTANRELQWPVRHVADALQRNLSGATQDEATIPLLEVA